VNEALEIQKKKHAPIGQILIELGYINQNDVRIALGAQAGMEPVELGKFDVPSEVIAQVPFLMATTYRVVPIDFEPTTRLLTVALDDPANFMATDDLKTLLNCQIRG